MKIIKLIIWLLGPLIFLISLVLPKNKKLWVYGAWFGERYADNSKALFEFSNSVEDNGIKHIWICKNQDIIEDIKGHGFRCYHTYSLKGIITQIRAKVFISSVNSSDFVPFLVTPRNFYVQLWHGSPLKHIGLDSRKSNFKKILDRVRFSTLDKYSLIISPAKIFDDIFAKAFYSKTNKIFRVGYPRNENLFVSDEMRMKIREYFNVKDGDTLVAYLPTHRNEGVGNSPFTKVLADILLENDYLESINTKIIVKPHYYERHNIEATNETNNVRIVFDMPFDLYEFLGASDLLITDYSSVMFDYESLNKPILVFPFDYVSYTSLDRGLYFDFSFIYDNLMHVERVDSVGDLLKKLDSPNIKHEQRKSIFNTEGQKKYSATLYKKINKELGL